MAPKSVASGHYRVKWACESGSRAGDWYPVVTDPDTGEMSCSCRGWVFKREGQARGCTHTDATRMVMNLSHNLAPQANNPLIQAVQHQWPGLAGTWSIAERQTHVGNKLYRVVTMQLVTPNGQTAMGTVAVCTRYGNADQRVREAVASWVGYGIAAEIARLNGHALVGAAPVYFKVNREGATAPVAGQRRSRGTSFTMRDILRVADETDLGDGLTPTQRAEATLRLFLGEATYARLNNDGYLDVCSVAYADRKRVYRLRRDPQHTRERRLRVFEERGGRLEYVNDFVRRVTRKWIALSEGQCWKERTGDTCLTRKRKPHGDQRMTGKRGWALVA